VTPIPALFAGEWSEPVLLRIGSGYDDDGEPYELYGQSDPVAPAGEGGEAMFTLLYVTTRRYDSPVSFWFTPFVDGEALETQRLDLPASTTDQGESETHEIGLTIPYTELGVEQLRYAARGTWFQLLVETRYGSEGGTPAEQIIESCTVEFEIVRESRPTADTTVS
jgi:hypothetical protein